MDTDESPEVLDDLRKKRLAYYETLNHSNAELGRNPDHQSSVSQKGGELQNEVKIKSLQKQNFKKLTTDKDKEFLQKGGLSSYTHQPNTKVDVKVGHISENGNCKQADNTLQSVPVKTTAFYFSNPDTSVQQVTAPNQSISGKHNDQSTVKTTHLSSQGTVSQANTDPQVEGYNETVERLIRATKEELLGKKSSDDIWSTIRKVSISESEKDNAPNFKSDIGQSDYQHVNSQTSLQSNGVESSSISKANMFDDHSYITASRNFHNHDENTPGSVNNYENSSQTDFTSNHPYSSKPTYSDFEPVQQQHNVTKSDTQKSVTSAKVEEIFSSRQMSKSQAAPRLQSYLQDSQDLETDQHEQAIRASFNLSELGLSTHRPESERKLDDGTEDLNLGDTVTKELRLLLGEEKFHQFLLKSKKDIDELHQSDRSDNSVRKDKTPRLIKDKPSTPKRPTSASKNMTREDIPGQGKNRKVNQRGAANEESIVQRPESGKLRESMPNENEENVGFASNRSQDFTPKFPDGDAVHSMIGQYVLSKKDTDASKRLTSNPAYKAKSVTKVESEDHLETMKSVPELNLTEFTQSESPRPKLNRPKHEPHTIYQARQKLEKDAAPEKLATDTSINSGKNYEQITVPRNVAFAASEIYNQAYGASYSEHDVMSPHHPENHGSPIMMQYTVPAGLSAPMTPTTPGGAIPISQTYMLNQQHSGHFNPTFHGEGSVNVNQQQQHYLQQQQFLLQHQQQQQQQQQQQRQQHHKHQFLSRQSSLTSDASGIPIPHPPNQQLQQTLGSPLTSPYNQVYNSMPEFRGYAPGMVTRFANPAMTTEESMHIPHPPVSGDGQRYSQPNQGDAQRYSQVNMSAVYSSSPGMPVGYPYPYQAMPMAPHPPATEPPQMAVSLQPQVPPPQPQMPSSDKEPITTPPSAAIASVPAVLSAVKSHTIDSWGSQKSSPDQQSHGIPEPPQTPSSSHVEEELAMPQKCTVVEESTFTSVSQIVVEDAFVPHPPPTKKESRPSPRRPPKMDNVPRQKQDSKRHIDGIRQHHEQRRQQHEEKLTDEQLLEKQRKFAKASLDRYFSSLENLYKPHKTRTISEHSSQASDDRECQFNDQVREEFETEMDVGKPADDVTDDVIDDDNDNVIEDVISNTYHQGINEFETQKGVSKLEDFVDEQKVDNSAQKLLKPPGNGTVIRDVVDSSLMDNHVDNTDNKSDVGAETLVNSEVTGFSVKAGGVTERLNELGIDVSNLNFGETREVTADGDVRIIGGKKDNKKGKVLIICPACKKFNKEYMSWCTQCGEMIIGVEPMLVSKNREGKIRTKPFKKDEIELKKEVNNNNVNNLKMNSEIIPPQIPIEINYVQDIPEKPFSLNLEGIKSPGKDVVSVTKNISPVKSDGKDSGRPSSDDPDNELQNVKLEQQVVDDICGSISDPIVKGYVMSHFAKKRQTAVDGKVKEKVHEDFHLSGLSLATDTRQLIRDEMKSKHGVDNNEMQNVETVENAVVKSAGQEEIAQQLFNTRDNVQSKIAIFEEKKSDNHFDKAKKNDKNLAVHNNDLEMSSFVKEKQDDPLIPPPLPSFSSAEPVSHNELALKLPANSMDFSADYSQAESNNFESVEATANLKDGLTEAEAKAERKKERRRKRGHGAIDVEVFGYEESRESRNSSRVHQEVPTLNLGGSSSDDNTNSDGNSSDEDDLSFQSDVPKPDIKFQPKPKAGSSNPTAASFNAWEPAIIPELIEEMWEPEVIPEETYDQSERSMSSGVARSNDNIRSPENVSPDIVVEQPRPNDIRHEEDNADWQNLFIPEDPQEENQEPDTTEAVSDVADLDQPFLMQVVNQNPTQSKSKQRPKSSKSKPVKSKVRQSIEEPGYQRKWARSSTAWSSFNQGELNTSSSLRSSLDQGRARPSSARSSSARPSSASGQRGRNLGNNETEQEDARTSSPVRQPSKKGRPASADIYRRKQQKQKGKKSNNQNDDFDLGLDLVNAMVEHRLPRQGMLERLQDHMASPGSTYDKLLEMTPRIQAGTLSRWQCLPDEILLHIFAYLDQSTLTKCAEVCHHFYRVAMDESLWKYITIKKKSDLDDRCLMEISKRHPISLALIQCHGEHVTASGLRDLFRECAESLKELNIARCSLGALHGDSLLLHAAARCHHITHIDTSWCNVTDSGLMAISNSCNRLQSLCINGCQAVTNDGLETVIRRHGVHLRVLEMFGCFNISPRGLRCISNNCINLLTLNLGQCYKLTDSCISQLSASLGRVESLDLRGCKQIKDNCIRRVVKNCTRLKHLSLANCPNITDVSVLEISTYLTDIRSIDLCGCKHITDGSIRALVNTCTNLRNIDISSTNCTHRSVSMIANFSGQRLETLKINFLADVTEQSLIKLAKHCHRLKSVHLYGCTSVRNLTKIKDERPSFSIEM